MAFERYFRAGSAPPDLKSFTCYFKQREGFRVESGTQACSANYENDFTGTYFQLNLAPEACDLRLNIPRPFFFAFEASIELQAFANALDLTIASSPDSNDWRPFDADEFLEDWQGANDWAVDHSRENEAEFFDQLCFVPAEDLAEIWNWNYNQYEIVEALAAEFDECSSSPLRVYRVDGRIEYLASWPAEAAIAFPDVATGAVVGEEAAGEEGPLNIVTRAQVLAAIGGGHRRLEDYRGCICEPILAPGALLDLQSLLSEGRPIEDVDIEREPFDHLVDAE